MPKYWNWGPVLRKWKTADLLRGPDPCQFPGREPKGRVLSLIMIAAAIMIIGTRSGPVLAS